MVTSNKWVVTAAIAVAVAVGLGVANNATSFAQVPAPTNGPPQPAKKLTLVGIDNGVTITAQFNPKEITIEKQVPWQKAPSSVGDQPEMEFSSAEGRLISFDLTFDTSDTQTDVGAAYVSKFAGLTNIMSPNGPEDKRRPTRVKVIWGGGGLPTFDCVIDSVSTKYTMFTPSGTPVRATTSVRMREASRASYRAYPPSASARRSP